VQNIFVIPGGLGYYVGEKRKENDTADQNVIILDFYLNSLMRVTIYGLVINPSFSETECTTDY
jgi:hypothetical protein